MLGLVFPEVPSRAVMHHICMCFYCCSIHIGASIQDKGVTSDVVDVSVRRVLPCSSVGGPRNEDAELCRFSHGWNRNPRPQPQTFSNLVFLI